MPENKEHPTVSGCSCHGCMSRRDFLGAASAGALAFSLVGGGTSGALAATSHEPIDAASLRPNPRVRIDMAFVRFKPPYWLGWPGSAYNVEDMRKRYMKEAQDAAKREHVDLDMSTKPIENKNALNAFLGKIKKEKPDGVLVVLQHMGTWPWVHQIADAGIPTVVFSPIGTSFTGHLVSFSRRRGVYVASGLDFGGVEYGMRMIRARQMLEGTRVIVIAGNERREVVLERLGLKVRYVPRRIFRDHFAQMPETDEVREVAERVTKHARKIVEPTKEDILNAARTYVTAKEILKSERANALSMDCLGMVGGRVVPTPPCMAWSLLQDSGVTAGCEADLFGAVSLMFVSYLFNRPGFLNDPVAETERNLLVTAHCTCGTRLTGFDGPQAPYILRSHAESNLGVSMQVLWREGQRVTLVRFKNPKELILDTGTVVENINTPPAGGCRTSLAIKMDRVEDARDVLGFHQAVFYGDHRREVEAFCQLYGLDVVHSPERSRTI